MNKNCLQYRNPFHLVNIFFRQITAIDTDSLRKKIQKLSAEEQFLAWLIAGGLNPEIHSPVSFAIATTLESKQTPLSPAIRLADLPAPELSQLIQKTLRKMEQNYLGPVISGGTGSADLTSLLEPVADSQERLRLLRRLADALYLAS